MKPKSIVVVAVSVLIVLATVIALVVSSRGTDVTEAPTSDRSISVAATAVPAAAFATLKKIDDGNWPESANAPGTKGGQTWRNQDRDLPSKDSAGRSVSYLEWDVNPKKRSQSRDAERIVTGSDGSAWYTGDHYRTFTRMR